MDRYYFKARGENQSGLKGGTECTRMVVSLKYYVRKLASLSLPPEKMLALAPYESS